MTTLPPDTAEWIEPDGLGGFASGTAALVRTRRYHALLLAATTPPTGRLVLVNGFDAWATTRTGRYALSAQRYTPDVTHPDGHTRVEMFTHEPFPRWIFALGDGTRIAQEIMAIHGRPLVVVSWRLLTPDQEVRVDVRPFLSGRDYHALHHENAATRSDTVPHADGTLEWRPYGGVPPVFSHGQEEFAPDPQWYRNFLYTAERERGLDCLEDLASPGVLSWRLRREATWALSTEHVGRATVESLREAEQRRRAAFVSPLQRAADAYVVERGTGRTIIAGYPWFTDWGRDTFIALPGICLATGQLDAARDILVSWAGVVSEGLLPNRFPDLGEGPEFNAVDASLWYAVGVGEFLDAAERTKTPITAADRGTLQRALARILHGYRDGTRHGIRMDEDGLVASGLPGLQLTWMDARVGDRVVTPRIGKPVEVQALWINALTIASRFDPGWGELSRLATASFHARYWNDARGCLYDVVDVDHVRGTADATLRPNQVLAAGGLPVALVSGDRARRMLETVRCELVVPLGLRTLAPGEPGYVGTYGGGAASRDGAYHQGTAWPWLLYAYVDAWQRVTGTAAADIVLPVLASLEQHLSAAGLGHVSEVVSGDPPHAPGGCPFQAWSLAALLRVRQLATAAQGAASDDGPAESGVA